MRPFLAVLFLTAALLPAGEVRILPGEEWKAADLSDLVIREGSALDFSGLVPRAPAGSSGRVIASASGGFAFEREPERNVRFLSFNILPDISMRESQLKDKKDLALYADVIRRHGYNMVRLHFLDGYLMGMGKIERKREGTLFDDPATIPFDAERFDRIHYFLSCLKERGIYVLLDLGTHNTGYTDSYPWNTAFRPYEFPLRLMVDPAFRANYRAGVLKLLTTENPYTGLSLAGDPMVACLVLFNEQSINIHASRLSADTTGPVNEILGPDWQAYLKKRYGTMQNLRAAWKDVELPADAGFGTLPPLTGPNFVRGEMGRDMARFFLEVQQETTGFLQSVVAESGYRGLTTHWDWQQYQYMTPLRGMMPVVSNHCYWAHPNQWVRRGSTIEQISAVGKEAYFIRALAVARFLDRPYLVSEYGHAFWNRFRHEQGLLVPAFAALQGWGGISLAHQSVIFGERPMVSFNNCGNDPVSRASEVVSTLAYLRGDVAPSRHTVELRVTERELFDRGRGYAENFSPVLGKIFPLCRIGLKYEGSTPQPAGAEYVPDLIIGAEEIILPGGRRIPRDSRNPDRQAVAVMRETGILPAENRTDMARRIYESDTGEILMNSAENGFVLTTPRLEGVLVRETLPVRADKLEVLSSSVPAMTAAASLDAAKPLGESSHLLVVYSTDALNSSMRFTSPDRTVIEEVGELPVLIRTGRAKIAVRNRALRNPAAYVLGFNGERRERLPIRRTEDGKLLLEFDTGNFAGGPSPFIEITGQE